MPSARRVLLDSAQVTETGLVRAEDEGGNADDRTA